MPNTVEQQAVILDSQQNDGHRFVRSYAGTGKTYVIREACLANPTKNIRYLVFAAKNAEEAKAKMPANVASSTFNALGNSLIWKQRARKLNENKTRNILWYKVFDFDSLENKKEIYKITNKICKLVSLGKNYLCYTWEQLEAILPDLCVKFGIEDAQEESFLDALQKTYKLAVEDGFVIDWDDQLFLTLKNNLLLPAHDLVFVDESQDCNPAKIEVVKRLAERGARVFCVGDPHQAIFGFAGADIQSVNTLIRLLDAKEMSLSVNFRCAKNIVREAQRIVPGIQWFEGSEEGLVNVSESFEPRIGDAVLCRTSAPLVRECLRMVRKGIPAVVLGKELGSDILDIVEKLNGSTIAEVLGALEVYREKQTEKLQRWPGMLAVLMDKLDVVAAVLDYCSTPSEVKGCVSKLFVSQGEGIIFATIHKAKGLEWNKVWCIKPELLPHPKATEDWEKVQETNLEYVMITRPRKELHYVLTPRKQS